MITRPKAALNLKNTQKKKPFKLYFVEAASEEENCFVGAKSTRSAEKLEEDDGGSDPYTCKATYVKDIEADWVNRYINSHDIISNETKAFFIQHEELNSLGVTWTVIEGNDHFQYGADVFRVQGFFNYLSDIRTQLSAKQSKIVIKSVSDLLEIVERDAPGDWIFRGQASCRWPLKAGIFRAEADTDTATIAETERRLLSEFKKQARAYLSNQPASMWDWLTIAQHFGLPTRLLDWSHNPLVALYFAAKKPKNIKDDGFLFAYRHGAPEIDVDTVPDPFSITQTEIVRPSHLDQRVITQKSVFTAEPSSNYEETRDGSQLLYWHVSVVSSELIVKDLEKLGISETFLFPGLESIAKEIRTRSGY